MTDTLADLLTFAPPARRASTKIRDNQRSRVYEAERTAHTRTRGGDIWTQDFPNDRLQARVDEILAMRAIQSRWGRRIVRVELGRGGGRAYGSTHISLGVNARNDWVIVHELAHSLVERRDDINREVAPHGPEFAGVLLFLTKTVMGKEAHDNLLAEFKRLKVRRNNKALPAAGTHKVVTKAQVAERKRIKAQTPLDRPQRLLTARNLRQGISSGLFGPSGSAARTAALATARRLEA